MMTVIVCTLNDNPIHIKNGMKNDFQIVEDHSEIKIKADSESACHKFPPTSVLSCLVFRGGLRDDDIYSVRMKVLKPMVFKAPDNCVLVYDQLGQWVGVSQRTRQLCTSV